MIGVIKLQSSLTLAIASKDQLLFAKDFEYTASIMDSVFAHLKSFSIQSLKIVVGPMIYSERPKDCQILRELPSEKKKVSTAISTDDLNIFSTLTKELQCDDVEVYSLFDYYELVFKKGKHLLIDYLSESFFVLTVIEDGKILSVVESASQQLPLWCRKLIKQYQIDSVINMLDNKQVIPELENLISNFNKMETSIKAYLSSCLFTLTGIKGVKVETSIGKLEDIPVEESLPIQKPVPKKLLKSLDTDIEEDFAEEVTVREDKKSINWTKAIVLLFCIILAGGSFYIYQGLPFWVSKMEENLPSVKDREESLRIESAYVDDLLTSYRKGENYLSTVTTPLEGLRNFGDLQEISYELGKITITLGVVSDEMLSKAEVYLADSFTVQNVEASSTEVKNGKELSVYVITCVSARR